MSERERLEELRRLDELRAKAEGAPSSKPSLKSKIQASIPGRILQGARDPIDAGAQLLPKSLEAVTGLFGLAPNPVSDFFGSEAQRVTNINNANEAAYQDARAADGQSGFDGARFTGNVVSPANLALARLLPVTGNMTAGQMATRGSAAGAAGGALQPVEDADPFWQAKGVQALTGGVTGGILTPVIGRIGQKRATRLPAGMSQLDDPAIQASLAKEGIDVQNLPKQVMDSLRKQANEAMKQGKTLDIPAALRKADFDALGVPALKGQITRDPMQFARERNLRGIEGVGDPIMARMNEQNRRLAELLQRQAVGAGTPMQAGQGFVNRLTGLDDSLNARVGSLYDKARDNLGRASPVNVQQFSEQANRVLDEQMLGRFLPEQVRGLLNDVSSGKIPLNVNTMVQIDSVLSAAQRSADDAGRKAIGAVRTALNNAQIADDVGVDAKRAFDVARRAARGRFALQEAVPALKDAVDGKIVPEKFVSQYVLGGSTQDVRRLVKVLDPNNRQQLAAQVGEFLQSQAFGPNPAGDALFTPSRFQSALKKIGPEKLEAVFGKQTADELNRIARVGAYINQAPGPAAVNTSNTAAAMANILSKIPGVSRVAGAAQAVGKAVVDPISKQRAVELALAAQAPQTPGAFAPESARTLARILGGAGPVLGTAASAGFFPNL